MYSNALSVSCANLQPTLVVGASGEEIEKCSRLSMLFLVYTNKINSSSSAIRNLDSRGTFATGTL